MFVTNYPAMKEGRYLIIGDLHIGITYDVKGVFIPNQVDILAERINELKNITNTKKLIILGDVKHFIGLDEKEKRDIKNFFEAIKFNDIIVTKGNHDGLLERIVDVDIRPYVVIGKTLFTHGHLKINTSVKRIVICHNHPAIRIKDRIGLSYIEPVWGVVNMEKEIVLMPSFNDICGKTIINENGVKLLGPIVSDVDVKNVKLYLLDSTPLGYVKDIMV